MPESSVFGPMSVSHRARRLLAALRDNPGHFSTTFWFDPGHLRDQITEIAPNTPLPAGVTLNVAGWCARLDGWTIQTNGICRKDGQERWIEYVAVEYLAIDSHSMFKLFNLMDKQHVLAVLTFMVQNDRLPQGQEYAMILQVRLPAPGGDSQ